MVGMILRKIYCLIVIMLMMLIQPACNRSETDLNRKITETKIRLVADGIITDATFRFVDERDAKVYPRPEEAPENACLRPENAYNDWRYWNGVLNLAMLKLSDLLDDTRYREFALENVAFGFDHSGYFEERWSGENKWEYPFGQFFITEELDDCGSMGASVIEIYHLEPQERYREYIEHAAEHILHKQDRLEDGTLVRSFPRRWTIWADDLYMSIVFLVRMGAMTSDRRYFDDAVKQVLRYHKYLFDEENQLMVHNWYTDTEKPSIAYWGRANGWALLAQTELLDHLPRYFPGRDTLLTLFRKHISGVMQYQDSSGLWHQLIDKDDSYLETSCSAIFTYVISRAVNKGYLSARYAPVARRGWKGILTRIRSDGQIEGVCTRTGIGDDLDFYYRRSTPLNDVHGVGFILLAGAEILELESK
ncbi:MAG TPA: glycoside hydrolase family 88 protein [Candidatus Marinimicrobia bacterium]|nr:glycoside hydrolase family 88 protein [Candidatus Neomarinimicrobiota bacterium]